MALMSDVYLDGHATTPAAPEVIAAMEPWWHDRAGNAHSPHGRGQASSAAVEIARQQVATLVGVAGSEISFTSGATEANNTALIGAFEAAVASGNPRRTIITSAIEHKSVLMAAEACGHLGASIVIAPVGRDGRVDLDELARLADGDTLLVSVMAANNEIGTVQPLDAIVGIARNAGALVHVDAAQIVGKLPFDVTNFDYASISAHKLYGPMGIGALFVSSATPLRPKPLSFGGGQEAGLRAGTVPVPLAIGFGMAASLAASRLLTDVDHGTQLAARLVQGLRDRQVRFEEVGSPIHRLPGSLSLRLVGVEAAALIERLKGEVCISDGSACNSGQILPSHTLRAIGMGDEASRQTIRLFCSRYNSPTEIDVAAEKISAAIQSELRAGPVIQ